jgi:hypothetical protein
MSYSNIVPIREIVEENILDKIGKYHLAGTIDLMPDDLKEIYNRWNVILDCFENGRYVDYREKSIKMPYSVRDLVKHLKATFEVSQSQAYEDIANAKYFHHLAKPREDKEFARGWLAEQLKRWIAICEHEKDFKSVAALVKNLIIVEGHDKHDADAPDYSKIQPPELIIVNDPREAIPNLPEVKDADKLLKEFCVFA